MIDDRFKTGTRVKIAKGNHSHSGEVGSIIDDDEVKIHEPEYIGILFLGEFWVKFDNPSSHIKICPFHPSEFEVIE